MKNTLLQNVISNFDLMDSQHFLDWFKGSKEWMLEQERKQTKEAFEAGEKNIDFDALHGHGKLSNSDKYVGGDRLK